VAPVGRNRFDIGALYVIVEFNDSDNDDDDNSSISSCYINDGKRPHRHMLRLTYINRGHTQACPSMPPPKKSAPSRGGSGPRLIHGLFGPTSPTPSKRHLYRSCDVRGVHSCDQQTHIDTHTDTHRYVGLGNNAPHPGLRKRCVLIIIITYNDNNNYK